MEIKLEFTFFGRNQPRGEFLKKFKANIIPFIGCENKDFLIMLIEIVKNIYDHADGWGYAKFLKSTNDEIQFHIGNMPKPKDAKVIPIGQNKNWRNFEIGMRGIKDIAEELNIRLLIDTQSGFVYRGVYRFNHHENN